MSYNSGTSNFFPRDAAVRLAASALLLLLLLQRVAFLCIQQQLAGFQLKRTCGYNDEGPQEVVPKSTNFMTSLMTHEFHHSTSLVVLLLQLKLVPGFPLLLVCFCGKDHTHSMCILVNPTVN
jgi:hypothetical protein